MVFSAAVIGFYNIVRTLFYHPGETS